VTWSPYLNAEALVRKRILLLPVLIAALLTMSASAAQAGAFVLTLEDLAGGGPVTITDNELLGLDANLSADKIRFVGTVGSFVVTIFANTYTPGPSGAPVQMNVSNFQVVSLSKGSLRATLSRTELSSPLLGSSVVGVGTSNVTITGAGSATFQSWIDETSVYNRSVPGGVSSTSSPVPVGSEFALLSVLEFNFDGGGTMMGSSDLQVRNAPVPEPTTLLLFGPGLAGLAALRRRRRSKTL
jgi:hypothetical protein